MSKRNGESHHQRRKRREAEQQYRNKWFAASRELMQKIKDSQQRINKLKHDVTEYKEKHGIHYELPTNESSTVAPATKNKKQKKQRIHGSFSKSTKIK